MMQKLTSTKAAVAIPWGISLVAALARAAKLVAIAAAGSLAIREASRRNPDRPYPYSIVTYVRIVDGKPYVGRTGGWGDPMQAASARDIRHHRPGEFLKVVRAIEFRLTRVQQMQNVVALRWAATGMEQDYMNFLRDQGVSTANGKRGVAVDHFMGFTYFNQMIRFGLRELAPFDGVPSRDFSRTGPAPTRIWSDPGLPNLEGGVPGS